MGGKKQEFSFKLRSCSNQQNTKEFYCKLLNKSSVACEQEIEEGETWTKVLKLGFWDQCSWSSLVQ